MPRFTLMQLLMAIVLIAIALAFFYRVRPAGDHPSIVCTVASSQSGKHLVVARLDDRRALGRRYATRTISIFDVQLASTVSVVERE